MREGTLKEGAGGDANSSVFFASCLWSPPPSPEEVHAYTYTQILLTGLAVKECVCDVCTEYLSPYVSSHTREMMASAVFLSFGFGGGGGYVCLCKRELTPFLSATDALLMIFDVFDFTE